MDAFGRPFRPPLSAILAILITKSGRPLLAKYSWASRLISSKLGSGGATSESALSRSSILG